MIEIVKYNTNLKLHWNEFVKESRNGTFLFQRDFMDYHSDRFEDHSLLLFKNKKIIALLPANIIRNKIVSHGGLTYGGLIVGEEARLPDVIKCFYSFLRYYNEMGIETLIYKQLPYYYHTSHTFEDEYVLFLLNAVLNRRDASFLLEMNNNITLQKGKKSNISKAKKEGTSVSLSENYMEFWNMVLEPNLMRSHNVKPVHSANEITLLAEKFPNNIKLHTATINNEIVAGTVLFINGSTVNVQYISANEKGKNTGVLDYLFDELLKQYRSYKYFNFGISNEDEGRYLNQGLVLWKEGFGARACSHNFYEVIPGNYKLLEKYLA